MKTNLLKSAVLAASLLGVLSPASAETLRARIPFEFTAAGTNMPAGAYTIHPFANAPSILLFENEDTKAKTIVFARSAAGFPVKPASPLTFTAGASEDMALTNISTAAWTYELSTRSPRSALKGAALALVSAK